MDWTFNINDDKHHKFLKAIETMNTIHLDTACYEHGIRYPKGEFKKYTPTSFVYAFFEFNVLYNYDWFSSIDKKELIESDKPTEKKKIESFVKFCFQNESFANQFKPSLFKIINCKYNDDEILEAFQTIVEDDGISQEEVNDFKDASKRIFDEGSDTFKVDMIDCLTFVYRIRCNLFHGHKTIKDIEYAPSQKTKLTVYFYFIISICQMFFSYLDYKKVPYHVEGHETSYSYKELSKRLGLNYDSY